MKQIKFYDIENDIVHGGILTDDGNVICACCGGVIPSDEMDTIEIMRVYDTWVDFSEFIIDEDS